MNRAGWVHFPANENIIDSFISRAIDRTESCPTCNKNQTYKGLSGKIRKTLYEETVRGVHRNSGLDPLQAAQTGTLSTPPPSACVKSKIAQISDIIYEQAYAKDIGDAMVEAILKLAPINHTNLEIYTLAALAPDRFLGDINVNTPQNPHVIIQILRNIIKHLVLRLYITTHNIQPTNTNTIYSPLTDPICQLSAYINQHEIINF